MIDLSLLGLLVLAALGIWTLSLIVIKFVFNDEHMLVAHNKLDTLIAHNKRRFFSVDDFNCQRSLVRLLLKYQHSDHEAYTLLEDFSLLHEISQELDPGDIADWKKYVNAFLDTTADRSNPDRL